MHRIPPTVLVPLAAAAFLAAPLVAGGPAAAAESAAPASAVFVGAAPAPPSGPGSGTLAVWQPGTGGVRNVSFATPGTLAGSSFFVAADRATGSLFVPTEAGRTAVVSTSSWTVEGSFASPAGSRVARTTPDGAIVLVESGTKVAGYQASAPYRMLFSDTVGGNALVIAPNGKNAFVGGNADPVVTELALPSGKVVQTFPVGHSGDMVWANGSIFSADIANGIMSVIHPGTGQVTRITTPEVDPNFSYKSIAAAAAGFMQLAVSPNQKFVYAAGFSGHILRFSTTQDTYLGEVAVTVDPTAPNKLSGLAIVPGGHLAVVTDENLDTSLVVSLRTGRIVSTQRDLAANRWISLDGALPTRAGG